MKILNLSLHTKWFDLTKASIKKEDYREINPYWCNRFLLFNGNTKKKEFWEAEVFKSDAHTPTQLLLSFLVKEIVSFKKYDKNKMTLGYPNNTDNLRIETFVNDGICIDYGQEEWGAEPNKLYFVIKHGKNENN